MNVNNTDRDVIRKLAREVAEAAARPRQQERRNGWQRINSLQPHRPMVWITEIPWGEFADQLEALTPVCRNERVRQVENQFRRVLFTEKHLAVDAVVDDTFWVPKHIEGLSFGIDLRERTIDQDGGSYIKSHHYEPELKEIEDIEKIKKPCVRYNRDATEQEMAFWLDLIGDILPVKEQGVRKHFFPAWDMLVRWTGVTEALMDLVARPDFIHAIMRRMTDCKLSQMDQLETQNLLDYPHPVSRVGSGGAGYTDELPQRGYDPEHITTMDQWGGATPQIFSDVSPEMHEEFALTYENEVMSRTGLNYYGCCEPLHNKMHLMAKVPRLRKISISPWCDTAKALENASQKYVFSHKPNPAVLAEDRFNVARAEKELRERLDLSGDMPCEVIMKDISTVRGDPERLVAWCEMARRVVTSGG